MYNGVSADNKLNQVFLIHFFVDLSARSTKVAMKRGHELILVMSLVGTCDLFILSFLHQLFNLSDISINFPISRKVVKKLLSLVRFAEFILDNSRSLLNHLGCRKLCLNPFLVTILNYLGKTGAPKAYKTYVWAGNRSNVCRSY